MINYFYTLTIIFLSVGYGYSQGLILDQEAYDALEKYDPSEEMGFASGNLPTSISYRAYTPYIGDQKGSSCAGWAIGYGMLSTMQNIRMNSTHKDFNTARAMDPYYIYAFQHNPGDSCNLGSRMEFGLEILRQYGCKLKHKEPILKCDSPVDKDYVSIESRRPYTINSYTPLDFSIENIKIELFKKNIVAIGTYLDSNFFNLNSQNYIWRPNNQLKIYNGHAMCIVGFDDSKFGGAFEVMNSWGANWGDEGYCWIKYEDLLTWTDELWVMDLSGYKNEDCLFGDCESNYSIYATKNGFYEGYLVDGIPDNNGLNYTDKKDEGFYFYTGEYNQGFRHGIGLIYVYDAVNNTRNRYPVQFNMGKLLDPNENQGFASGQLDIEMMQIFNHLNNSLKGELVDTDSDEYEDFMNNYEMSEEPVVIKKD